MSVDAQAIAFVEDLFAPLGPISHRRMMGGLTMYHEGQIFAILDSSGTVFLKAKGAFAKVLAATGARQFGAVSGRTMGYWTLPEPALDDPELASDWAKQALAALQ